MERNTRAILLGIGLTVSSLVASAEQVFTVACTAGETINGALARGDSRKPVTIQVSGTCTENVVIARDDVTILGMAAGVSAADPSRPTIWVQGTRVVVGGLAVNGGLHAIEVSGGNAVTIQSVALYGATANGLYVVNGAATVTDSSITNSGEAGILLRDAAARVIDGQIFGNMGPGIHAVRNSGASTYETTIRNNAVGILFDTGSTVVMNGDTIGPNAGRGLELATHSNANLTDVTISGNNAGGILLDTGSTAAISGGTIGPNGGSGIALASNSTAKLTDVPITGNGAGGVLLDTGSTVTISGGTIGPNGGSGIALASNSTAKLTGVALTHNGIQTSHHGISAAFSQVIMEGGSITQSAGRGMDLYASIADLSGAAIDNNTRDGIRGRAGSTVSLESTSVSNNGGNGVFMQFNSNLQTSNVGGVSTAVKGNDGAGILLQYASKLLATYIVASGNGTYGLDCMDGESSYLISTGIDGTVAAACTGY